ncbi:MAG TPA: Hsp20/alpha crystallin family protein, partial [Candidatus Omnitrophota bacterium]|nr:Hsp20/alpha crystallin family protein [Candidatus Omnitrophota bacterium]
PVFGDVDIRETDKEMIVKVDLPGVKKEAITVKIEDAKVLRIYGRRDNEKEDIWNKGYVRTYQSERHHGKFQRRIDLPALAKDTGIEAQYENGVLTVRIPKLAETKKEVNISIQ